MSELRVAYVLGTSSGGTGRHVAMLASAGVAAGAAVTVLGPEPGFFLAGGAEFSPVAITDRARPAGDLAALRRLRSLLVGFRPDVVHAHGLRAGALAALAVPSAVALVVTVHNAPPLRRRHALIYGVLERLVARRANVVLCVSPDLEARMRRLGARSVQRAVVPAPAANAAAGSAVARPAAAGSAAAGPAPAAGLASAGAGLASAGAGLAAGGRPVVLGVGRLAPQKGFDLLLAAARTWADRRPLPLVVIAGDGPLAGALAAQAAELGVDARFLGQRDDVADLLGVADVFVLPSRWEGQPLILQEAMRAGLPIVAADVGGVRPLVEDAGDGSVAGEPAESVAGKSVAGEPGAPGDGAWLVSAQNPGDPEDGSVAGEPAESVAGKSVAGEPGAPGDGAWLAPAQNPADPGDGAAVWLVPGEDAAALGAAVARLLDDPALRAQLGAAALARAARLPTEDEAGAAALTLYLDLATSPAGGRAKRGQRR